jgi:photosystem II stability/assembly factor-like uncharacterized protein
MNSPRSDTPARSPGALLGISAALLLLVAGSAARANVVSLTIDPASVCGGTTAQGTAVIDPPSPSIQSISLHSDNPAVASVPATASTRRAFDTVIGFAITTFPVCTPTVVTITATHGLNSRQAQITVNPPSFTSMVFNPDPVVGGSTTVATITLSCAAPANSSNCWLFNISSTSPHVNFPQGTLVGFEPGALLTTKVIGTLPVTMAEAALIRLTPAQNLQGPSYSAYVSIVPIRVQSITFDPQSISGGGAAQCCVELNAPAPAGGANVLLSSDNPAVLPLPASVIIPATQTMYCFEVQSQNVTECTAVGVNATYRQTVFTTLNVGPNEQLTSNVLDDRWNNRHSTTVNGGVLWTDGDDVFFNNGAATQRIQARGDLDAVDSTVLGLGSGASASEVIGVWRRGTDYAWVWRSGGEPIEIAIPSPFNPNFLLNPEALAVADGHVFVVFRAAVGGQNVLHVYRVDPVTGAAVNLTGNAAVPGASRVSTSRGEAAWYFNDGSGPGQLHYYNGSSVQIVDSGDIFPLYVRISRGRIVYQKSVAGIAHIFLYDTNLPNPAPARLSADTDAAHGNYAPATDGRHVAWFYGDAGGSNLNIRLLGGLQLNDVMSRPYTPIGSGDLPLQIHGGQALWKDESYEMRFFAGLAASGSVADIVSICAAPGREIRDPWLGDGSIAWYGPAGSIENDNEIFIRSGVAPDHSDQPAPPMLVRASAGSRRVTLDWDLVLGASSYNVYLAELPGVTKDNYAALPGGRRIAGVTAGHLDVADLANGRVYYFVVTALEGAGEGGNSSEISALPNPAWERLAPGRFWGVAAEPANAAVAYAAGVHAIYKTVDGGFTWFALAGIPATEQVAALAVRGQRVFAVTLEGDVYRSLNAGASWARVVDGESLGDFKMAIAIDPANPDAIYAGDVLLSPNAQSNLIKSTDGGATWAQLPGSPVGDIRAYDIAIDATGLVYVAGTGVPVVRSADGGQTWTDLELPASSAQSLALDPQIPGTIYGGTSANGVFKSINGGESWAAVNSGLESANGFTALLDDSPSAGTIYAGSDTGFHMTLDGGAHWIANNAGLDGHGIYALARTSAGRLIAGTYDGLYLLDLGSRSADMNCDGLLNNFDIDPFVLALTSAAAYQAAFPNCDRNNADANHDGLINNFDIDPFVTCLTVGCE